MANTKKWSTPGDYDLIDLSILLHNDTKIDIMPSVVQIEWFESIFANGIHGNIVIQDTDSILESAVIIGSEQVSIKLTTSNHNDYTVINKVFDIVKISDFIDNGKEKFYTIHLMSPIMRLDKNYKLSKAYDDYSENIVETVMRNTLGMTDELRTDLTKYPRKLVVPRLSPLKLFNYLGETSINGVSDSDLNTGFVFYEDNTG